MPTVYRLVPEGKDIDLEYDRLKLAFPPTIELLSKADGLYAIVASDGDEDSDTQSLIDRELDRLFFLTCVPLHAEMCRRTVVVDQKVGWRIQGRIPEGTGPQRWTDQLPLQLRLWAIAAGSTDPHIKVLLFFQIIELSYPNVRDKTDYPTYDDTSHPPHARTEAKLLRHLVAHAGNAWPETARYLKFLGLPPRLSNRAHPEWFRVISMRVPCVEAQARAVLQSAL